MPPSEGPQQEPRSKARAAQWRWLDRIIAAGMVLVPAILIITFLAHRLWVQAGEKRRSLEAESTAVKQAQDTATQLNAERQRREQAEGILRARDLAAEHALHAAEAALAERDESWRRRSMAAYSQRLSTQPNVTRRWPEEMRRLAVEAQDKATQLLGQGTLHIAQKRYADAEPLLLQALERLDTRDPGRSDLFETRGLSLRWRILTGLERVYGPSGLNLPLRRAVVEELARRPATPTSGTLTGQVEILPSSELGSAETWLNLVGTTASFKVTEVLGDVAVSPDSGTLPARLHVTAREVGLHPYGISVEAGPKILKATGVLLVAEWDVRFFQWSAASNPLTSERGWQELIAGKPLAYLKTNSIHFTWWDKSPAPEAPSDNFATVATTSVPLAGGRYKVWTSADDGVRVWIDDMQLIDDWRWRPPRENSTTVRLNRGPHKIRIEHFEETQHAQLHFGMELLD